jgi:hypothetical protein
MSHKKSERGVTLPWPRVTAVEAVHCSHMKDGFPMTKTYLIILLRSQQILRLLHFLLRNILRQRMNEMVRPRRIITWTTWIQFTPCQSNIKMRPQRSIILHFLRYRKTRINNSILIIIPKLECYFIEHSSFWIDLCKGL